MPPVPSPEDVPAPILPPPPARAPEVEEHLPRAAAVEEHDETATTVAAPLFTIKVWQLGFAVIAVMLGLLYALGIL
jgi:hypothetical protein